MRVAVQRRMLRREIPPATWTVVAQTRYVQTTPSQLAAAKGTLARWVMPKACFSSLPDTSPLMG